MHAEVFETYLLYFSGSKCISYIGLYKCLYMFCTCTYMYLGKDHALLVYFIFNGLNFSKILTLLFLEYYLIPTLIVWLIILLLVTQKEFFFCCIFLTAYTALPIYISMVNSMNLSSP